MEQYRNEKDGVEPMTPEEILVVQGDVFAADTNYANAKEAARIKLVEQQEIARRSGRELSAEERGSIVRAPVLQYIAERAPIFRFFAEHLSDPEAIMHFKKAAETHDHTEVAEILTLFEKFRVEIERSIEATDPDAWNTLIHAIEEVDIHPEQQEGINKIFEDFLPPRNT